MIHHRQRLPLGLEARDDLTAVHARLDDLERDFALHRLHLLGHPHDAHAAFADLLQELVRTDDGAGAFADEIIDRGAAPHLRRLSAKRRGKSGRGRLQKIAGAGAGFEQGFYLDP